MTGFGTFISVTLSSVATFLGSDPVIWVTGTCVLLGIIAAVQRLIKL